MKGINLIPYGLKGDRIVYVKDVENGYACGCICPKCGQPLNARNGGESNTPHFAHQSGKNCEGAYEETKHRLAIQIIHDEKCVMLPSYKEVVDQERVHFKDLIQEARTLCDGIIPDIVGIRDDNTRICIEIRYTHAVDEDKLSKIKSHKLNCLEIDIRNHQLDEKELREFLIESTQDRVWLNHPEYENRYLEIEARKKEEQEKVEKREREEFEEYERIARAKELERIKREESERIKSLRPLPTELVKALNPAQLEAVQCIDAPSLVIAGAGSGKTRVLTYKIAYLMQQGIEPWNILALTFTNKAAREMRERIGRLVGEHEASMLWMGTFHSIFYRILRYESDAIGFSSHFTIYDDRDSASLIKNIIKEMGLDEKQYRPGIVANRISEAKNELIRPTQYARDYQLMRRDQASRMSRVHEIYATYQQRLHQSDAMDFDDLLLYTYVLLSERPDIRQKYEERFQFVLVDEYQDTNYAQHQIVWLLTEHRQRVSVVGDDAQSIYSFRGARIDNILNFQKSYQGARLFKLEQNYRSTQTIVGAANSVIHNNRRQIHKDVFSEKAEGDKIELCEAYSDKEEAAIVSRKIYDLTHNGQYGFGDITILYRTNSQSKSFEDEFKRRRFPYRIYGGLSFYQRKEVKDAVAYLRLAVNPMDEEALRRVINYPSRGIGKTTLDRVYQVAIDNAISPFQVISDPSSFSLSVNKPTQAKLQQFAQFIMSYHDLVSTEQADTLAIRMLRESGLVAEINAGREPEDRERQENLQTLIDDISASVSDNKEEGQSVLLTEYLQNIVLLTDQDKDEAGNQPRITLMTIHAAKGLEFPVVFIVGMEENLFPSEMAVEEGNIEEERRLFYVAITRAASRLFLTWSHSRMRFGKFENNQRSRFIREIDKQFLSKSQPLGGSLFSGSTPASPQTLNKSASLGDFGSQHKTENEPVAKTPNASLRPVRSYQSDYTAKTPLQSEAGELQVGSRIEHSRFGRGVVTAIEGTGLDTKAVVEFENAGQKQLLLRFARFTVL